VPLASSWIGYTVVQECAPEPVIQIRSGDVSTELPATPITDSSQVLSIVERFRAKYGASNVKKYYSKLDVAVLARMKEDSAAGQEAQAKLA